MWAIDFPFDATTDGRLIKIANVIDEHTRQALSGQVARSITADDLGLGTCDPRARGELLYSSEVQQPSRPERTTGDRAARS